MALLVPCAGQTLASGMPMRGRTRFSAGTPARSHAMRKMGSDIAASLLFNNLGSNDCGHPAEATVVDQIFGRLLVDFWSTNGRPPLWSTTYLVDQSGQLQRDVLLT